MVQFWSGEGKIRRGVWAGAERREAWQGLGGVKKYKSGTGKLQKFSWNELTEGNEALAKFNQQIKNLSVVKN